MNKRTLLLATSAAWLALAGCASTPAPKTIAGTAAATPSLSTLNKLIADAGLTETLNGAGPYTVFAPTDDAFKAVPAKTLDALSKDKEQLKAVLLYHVAPGKVLAADVQPGNLKTAQGNNLAVAKAGSFVTVDEALVTQTDVVASNGVVHVIDKVLIPPVKK
ncbi:fasciclin domain-containing protein [Methylibium petroleiphilum]|uniref:fasciclin domain-containing protein n=1 Tax=Methylibium petroleiphilum TaxID=105560 RepID=UPI001AC6496D|nr:fasciclin domain-containing protein [Methylibium petroleiphilum]MBN9203265.1 fasciclin domain-containing protein [Methylibium petroleiphilum]